MTGPAGRTGSAEEPSGADAGAECGAGIRTRIGLEVHVQLDTATKMFCRCPAAYGAAPNTHVCPVCLGYPGALPVPNREAVRLAVRAALGLECELHRRSRFDRKHYFYPDLPKGYQITQYERPLASGGGVVPGRAQESGSGSERRVAVERLHLEEDAGKSLHDRFPGATAVDLNRAGIPLLEIVTEPVLRSPEEARACLQRLKQILEHYARVSDCNMEEGSLRVDANLSVAPPGSPRPTVKTEVKNLNSFSYVERALRHERERQLRRLRAGEPVRAETRLWDPSRGVTRALRGKEETFDYRYVPDPDLPPLELSDAVVRREEAALGAPPHVVEARLRARYGLSGRDAARIAAMPERAAYFERVVGGRDKAFAGVAANFLLGPLAAEANRRGTAVWQRVVEPSRLRRVVELRIGGTLSADTAERTIRLLAAGEPGAVDELVRSRDLAQVRDPERIEAWVEEAVGRHPEEAARYAQGEERLLGFFMGRVMEAAEGRADPERARDALRRKLASEDPDPGPDGS